MPTATIAPVREIAGHAAWVKRERVIGVATELFDERGYEHTSVEAIADRMGVSKPFFYLHFSAKSEVLVEICARGVVAVLGALTRAMDMPGSPTERLAAVARGAAAGMLANRSSLAILAREQKHLPHEDRLMLEEVVRGMETQLTELLDEGCATGAFALRDTELAATAMLNMMMAAHAWPQVAGRRRSPEEIVHEIAALVVAMTGVRGREATPGGWADPRARQPEIAPRDGIVRQARAWTAGLERGERASASVTVLGVAGRPAGNGMEPAAS